MKDITKGQLVCFQTKYESEVQTVDFVSEGRQIEKDVNSWVSEKTNNMITDLLQENSLTPDTILVLLNAVYFKGRFDLKISCTVFTSFYLLPPAIRNTE